MVANPSEIRNIKRIKLEHISLQRARRLISEMFENVGRNSANQSLKVTLLALKKELMAY